MCSYVYVDGWKSNIHFSSAHIIPEYDKCGRVHGHTYAVHVKVTGKPDENGIIVDFSVLKKIIRNIADDLDHKVLIPEKNNIVNIKKDESNVRLSSNGKNIFFR